MNNFEEITAAVTENIECRKKKSVWKSGTAAPSADNVDGSHIDNYGAGSSYHAPYNVRGCGCGCGRGNYRGGRGRGFYRGGRFAGDIYKTTTTPEIIATSQETSS